MNLFQSCGSYQDFLDRGLLLTRKLLNQGFIFGKVEVITSKILRSPPWLGWPLWNICVTNDHGYVPLVVNTSRSFSHSWLITGFVTRLIQLVPLVEQELLTLPEHLNSPPVFSGVRVTRSLVLYVFCRSLFVLLYFFFWPLCCLFFFDIRILIAPLVWVNVQKNRLKWVISLYIWFMGVWVMVFNATFNNISVILWLSFIGGGNQSTQRNLLTCRKSLTNFITWCCIKYTSPEQDSNS